MVCPTPQSCSCATITAIVADLGTVRVLRCVAVGAGRSSSQAPGGGRLIHLET